MATNKLEGVHPALVEKVKRIQAAMAALGFPMVVTAGRRTVAEQQALYAQGRTKPGAIVTNADGVTHRSNHQEKSDGFGHAVDLAFVDGAGQPSWAEHWPWNAYGACVQAVGLVWGGAWISIKDRPHCELP